VLRRRLVRYGWMFVAGLAICYMFYGLVFSDHGYLVYRQELQQVEQLRQEMARMREEREQLARRVLRLRDDPEALEELIRRELGYVYKDEYMLIRPEATGQGDRAPDSQAVDPSGTP